jgi:hypothetical protein
MTTTITDGNSSAQLKDATITFYRDGASRGSAEVRSTGFQVTLPDGTERFVVAQALLAAAANPDFLISDHVYGNCKPGDHTYMDHKPLSEWQPYADGPKDRP